MTQDQDYVTGASFISGQEARDYNTKVITDIAFSVQTSFGPLGLDKMCVDSAGDVHISNDGATILKNMEVSEPAATLLVDIAKNQDENVGDGTTGVVLLTSFLVEEGNKLIKRGLHPSIISDGYKIAYKTCIEFLKEKFSKKTNELEGNVFMNVIKTCISSKIIREHKDFFGKLIYNSVMKIKEDEQEIEVQRINILKKQGGSMLDSFGVNGYAINCTPASTLMPKEINNPKLILIDFDLRKTKMPLNVNVVVETPDKIEEIRKNELKISLEKIDRILKSGVNLVLSTKGIDEFCMKPFIENKSIAVRRVRESDLETLSSALKIPILKSIDDLNEDNIKLINSVKVKPVSESELILLEFEEHGASSIVLRGVNEQLLDEMERSIHDGLCVLKKTIETSKVVPGGGAAEVALSITLEKALEENTGKEYLSILKFKEAILKLPKILIANAGLDSNDIITKLEFHHRKNYENTDTNLLYYGFCPYTGELQNNLEKGIIEPLQIRLQALRSATEAAISILRINDIINIPKEKKKMKETCE